MYTYIHIYIGFATFIDSVHDFVRFALICCLKVLNKK